MASFRVILVDPLYEGNVGHAARAMMNFGITDLAIVGGPRALGNDAKERAVHAGTVLEGARRATTLDEAADGCDLLAGFTARITKHEGQYRRNPIDVRDWAPAAAAHPGRVGLVFGREDRGLTNEEADRCNSLVSIPTDDIYRSLNLAHAVAVAGYALFAESRTARVKDYTPAEMKHLDRLVDRFGLVLAASDYPEHKRPATTTMFRRLVGRSDPTHLEVTTLLGVLRDSLWHLGVKRKRVAAEHAMPDADANDYAKEDAVLHRIFDGIEPTGSRAPKGPARTEPSDRSIRSRKAVEGRA